MSKNNMLARIKNFDPDYTQDSITFDIWESFAKKMARSDYPKWQYNGVALMNDITIWCDRNLGENYIFNGFETIYFKEEQHKMLFLLRWA